MLSRLISSISRPSIYIPSSNPIESIHSSSPTPRVALPFISILLRSLLSFVQDLFLAIVHLLSSYISNTEATVRVFYKTIELK